MTNLDSLSSENIFKHGKDLISNLFTLIRMTDMYSSKNMSLSKAADKLIADITVISGEVQEISLKTTENAFFLEDFRIKPPPSDIGKFDSFLAELKKREIGQIGFKKPLDVDELISFAYAFKSGITLIPLQTEFKTKSINCVTLGGIGAIQEEENIDLLNEETISRRAYLGVFNLSKDFYNLHKQGDQIEFKKLKRKTQILIDCLLKNEADIFRFIEYNPTTENYLFLHILHVTILSLILGKKIGLKKYHLGMLGISAFLHDLGKFNIPQEILNKTAEFNEEEMELIKKHPMEGVWSLLNRKRPNETSIISMLVSYEHHWKLDYSGYPLNTDKKKPNLFSQIIGITDEFDALVSGRVYQRTAYPFSEAFKIIYQKSGKEYDPILVRSFISIFS